MRHRANEGELLVVRRYWPAVHDLLRSHGGRWTAHAGESTMQLSLEPHLIDVLKEALPHGAIVEVDRA